MTQLKKAEAEAFKLRTDWLKTARDKQLQPKDEHFIWLLLAGRGFGKTRTGAQDIALFALRHENVNCAVVAPTHGDLRRVLNKSNQDKNLDKITRNYTFLNNPAALLASSWFFCCRGIGERDMVVLPYRDRLQVFSKYLQQLVMESLGKKMDRSGNVVNQGISVFGNKGSTDQHAYVQQLRDGIDNFFCVFIELLDSPTNLNIFDLDNPKDYLSGFMQGTRSALSNQGRQSITITLKELNAISLGALVALFERTVTFYAELVNVNAYDQPGVEAGKKAAAEVIAAQLNIQKLFLSRNKLTFKDIDLNLKNTSPETIFFILRQMCYSNSKYQVKGSWSDPYSLVIEKLV